jgi:hypothetical protein
MKGLTRVGRHSGAVCTACQQRILVRDGRLIEHQHTFPILGRSVPCVGSHSRADGAAAQTPPDGRAEAGPGALLHPTVARLAETVSR